MICALVHGNELCGGHQRPSGSRSAPGSGTADAQFANPAAFDRFNPEHHDASRFVDEDLNRQWSDDRISNPTSLSAVAQHNSNLC
jgi:hypothetical protein